MLWIQQAITFILALKFVWAGRSQTYKSNKEKSIFLYESAQEGI